MTQCCYKTHRENPKNLPKIDAVSTFQLLRGNTKGTLNKYPFATLIFGFWATFIYNKKIFRNDPITYYVERLSVASESS